jgi:hypothetical protein
VYLESPEGVAGVCAAVEEAAGLCAGTKQIFCRQALGLGDVPDLVVDTQSQRDEK